MIEIKKYFDLEKMKINFNSQLKHTPFVLATILIGKGMKTPFLICHHFGVDFKMSEGEFIWEKVGDIEISIINQLYEVFDNCELSLCIENDTYFLQCVKN